MSIETRQRFDSEPGEKPKIIPFPIETKIESSDPAEIKEAVYKTFRQTDKVAEMLMSVLEEHKWKPKNEHADIFAAVKEPLDNAALHGNYGLGKREEQKDLTAQTVEKILERIEAGESIPSQCHCRAEVYSDRIVITISDKGNGFDWRKFTDELDEKRLMENSGRGIFLTFQAFGLEHVKFNEAGNEITLTALLNHQA